MAQRVVVFIDHQNVYADAREAFFDDGDHHAKGQYDPLHFGQRICDRKPKRELKEVRVYAGIPASSRDSKGYAARRRQIAYWRSTGAYVSQRTLKYPPDWPKRPEREKGIDVQLAIDFVAMAVNKEYDVGVIASTDTDLRPAMEFVATLDDVVAEEAAWWNSIKKQLSKPEAKIWCHRLNKEDYDFVCDTRDYNVSNK